MYILKFILIPLLAVTFLYACSKNETGSVREKSPAYGTEETKAPAYGEAKAPDYGEVTVPGYGEVEAPAYGGAEGDAPSGNILFSDKTLGGSTNSNSCETCHPGGKGLELSGSKSKFNIMGMEQSSLEAAVNICIVMPLEGKAINPIGKDMKDIVAYIRSLKK